MKRLFLTVVLAAAGWCAYAQNYMIVDSEKIFKSIDAYNTAIKDLDKMAEDYQKQVDDKFAEIETLYNNYQQQKASLSATTRQVLDLALNTALDHAGLAVIVYLGLVLTESLWRRVRHAPGIGMGDVKALFALCTFDPLGGVVAFAVALLTLAVACLFTKSRSLPLLPFLVPIFAIIEVVGCTL